MIIAFASDDSKFSAQVRGLLREQSHDIAQLPKPASALPFLRETAAQMLVVVEPYFKSELVPFLRSLREDAATRSLPVLCVSPTAAIESGVACLDAGADDFINRPFNAQIFLARVRTLLRRRVWSGGLDEDNVTSLQGGPISIKLLQREVRVDGKLLELTRLEFDLLSFLLRSIEQVHKREDILAAVWNYPGNVETRTLDKHVEMLRRKLGKHGSSIETVHGVGYRFLNRQKPSRAAR